jgi:hypothetical protein
MAFGKTICLIWTCPKNGLRKTTLQINWIPTGRKKREGMKRLRK